MFNIFKDNKKQKSFEKNGFEIIESLLSTEDILTLKDFYKKNLSSEIKNSVYGMYVSLDEPDKKLKKAATDIIEKTVKGKLDNHFINYKTHLGSYLVKVPDEFSFTYPHQDWLFVDNDEVEYFSATIWISLEDINTQSGNLGFIKGSHQFINNILGSPSPEIITATMGHETLLISYLQFSNIKAGDAFIFNNKTIHAAFPNTTQTDRIAVGIGITPKPAELYHYFLKPGTTNKIYKLKTTPEFYENNTNDTLRATYKSKSIPQYASIEEELNYNPTLYNAAQMEELLIKSGNVKNNIPIVGLFGNVNITLLTKIKYLLQSGIHKIFS
jgi:hypothetical protein